jgi:hypothetical protein
MQQDLIPLEYLRDSEDEEFSYSLSATDYEDQLQNQSFACTPTSVLFQESMHVSSSWFRSANRLSQHWKHTWETRENTSFGMNYSPILIAPFVE